MGEKNSDESVVLIYLDPPFNSDKNNKLFDTKVESASKIIPQAISRRRKPFPVSYRTEQRFADKAWISQVAN